MANSQDFKNIAKKRLETVEILMSHQEWEMSAYLMGFVLECILKASACHNLKLKIYPEEISIVKHKNITGYFRTHDFEMLKVISGVSELFDLSADGASSWSGFTQEYTGSWTEIRYDQLSNRFDETKVKSLHNFLTAEPNGIIPLIKKRNVW